MKRDEMIEEMEKVMCDFGSPILKEDFSELATALTDHFLKRHVEVLERLKYKLDPINEDTPEVRAAIAVNNRIQTAINEARGE